MSIIFTILIIILILVVTMLVVAAFARKDYSIEREIVVNRPKKEVFDYLKQLKNQDHYNVWVMKDPDMKKEFRGVDGTVGFVYAWDGNQKAGKGEQEIVGIDEGNKLNLEIRFVRPFESVANTPFTTTLVSENETKVKWGMSSSMKYPMNIMLVVMNMEKLLGGDMDTSLNLLKDNLEAK